MTDIRLAGISNTYVRVYSTPGTPAMITLRAPNSGSQAQKRTYYRTVQDWYKDYVTLYESCERKNLRNEINISIQGWSADNKTRKNEIKKYILEHNLTKSFGKQSTAHGKKNKKFFIDTATRVRRAYASNC